MFSALALEADIREPLRHFRVVPKRDIVAGEPPRAAAV
jgi:hypothetical protein